MMMMNAIGNTPAATTGGTSTTPTPATGSQGQSTLGYGPTYGYNPYPSPFPTGLPGSSITSMNPYGYGAGGGAMYGGGNYGYGNTQYGGGSYGNMMGGNPYGGYQNNTGTGGLNPQTGLAQGYGYESAVSPTVFQGALSGDGTLPSVHPGRIAQEFIGRENGEHKANAIGAAVGVGSSLVVYGWLRQIGFRGVPQLLTALGVGAAVGLSAKFGAQPSLEKLSKNVALSEDYADNGHIDSSRLLQKNFEPDLKLFNNYI